MTARDTGGTFPSSICSYETLWGNNLSPLRPANRVSVCGKRDSFVAFCTALLRVHSLLRTAVALFRIVRSPFLAYVGVFAAPRGLSLSPGVQLYLIASDPRFRILLKDDIFYSYTRKVSGVCAQFFVGSVSPRPLSLTTLYCFRGIKSTLPCVRCRVVPHSIVYYTTAYKCVL